MACTVETVAFGPRQGGGILPHEETFSGPKEDNASRRHEGDPGALSPIFGLHPDDKGQATAVIARICGFACTRCHGDHR